MLFIVFFLIPLVTNLYFFAQSLSPSSLLDAGAAAESASSSSQVYFPPSTILCNDTNPSLLPPPSSSSSSSSLHPNNTTDKRNHDDEDDDRTMLSTKIIMSNHSWSLAVRQSWDSLKMQRHTNRKAILQQTISYAVPKKDNQRIKPDEDVTLLSHVSTNKLDSLVRQVLRWKGPVSAAIYICSDADVEEFITVVTNHWDHAFFRTTFHIFFETPPASRGYPYNILRNIALQYMETDYFLALDSDFVTMPDGHDRLVGYLANKQIKAMLQSKTIMVLPAFEHTIHAIMHNVSTIPESKEQVIQQVQDNISAPFQLEKFFPSHGPTNFSHWLSIPSPTPINATTTKTKTTTTSTTTTTNNDLTYPITYIARFEPYVLGYKPGIPNYWPTFRGYHFDKISWFAEMRFMGYQFVVLDQDFVFHVGKSTSTPTHKKLQFVYGLWGQFKNYLASRYQAPIDEKYW